MLRLLVASLSWAAARADTCTALRGGPFTYEQESAPRDISAALRPKRARHAESAFPRAGCGLSNAAAHIVGSHAEPSSGARAARRGAVMRFRPLAC